MSLRALSLTLAEPAHWHNYLDPTHGVGVLFVPLDDAPPVGDLVNVKVNFIAGPTFYLQGLIVWRRAGPSSSRLRAGAGVQIQDADRSKVAYIHGYARGGMMDRRTAPRLPIRLPVTYQTVEGRRMNFTRDITTGGLLISAASPLPLATPVSLVLVPPPPDAPVRLGGRVVRLEEDSRGKAMAIELTLLDDEVRRHFEQLVRSLEKALLNGSLAEQYLANT